MSTEREIELLRDVADLREEIRGWRMRVRFQSWLKENREEQRDELDRGLRELLNEVDCRIEHGAQSGGHLEYVRERLIELAARW